MSQSAPSGKRARLSNGRRSPAASEQSDVEEDEDDEMFDIEKLESKSHVIYESQALAQASNWAASQHG